MRAPFSQRTSWNLAESDFARAVRALREGGAPPINLTRSNPTACGFHESGQEVLAPLAIASALSYDPDPFGAVGAREAITAYYADHRASVPASHIVLTSSTSEAYSHLFRLLCDAGDEVLIAQPSYPLFDFLAGLTDVVLRPYPLFYDFGWWIDFACLERAITPRTRALVVVHPNNPTGHVTSGAERQRLRDLCARTGLALIVDEVFLDYGLGPEGVTSLESFAMHDHAGLCFVLSGLSKVVALPQMKVGWIAVLGPPALRDEALARLEVIADTYLSVNTPAQLAVPAWLAGRANIQAEIVARLRANLALLGGAGLEVLTLDAGWSAVVRLPAMSQAAPVAERLLARGVLVHPGSFYGMSGYNRIVVSLLTPEEEFRRGAAEVAAMMREDIAGTG